MVLQISPWERDALRLLAGGVPDEEIAAVLRISEGTVSSYLAYLFEKSGVSSRTEAVRAAARRGFGAPDRIAEHREGLPLLIPECETSRDASQS